MGQSAEQAILDLARADAIDIESGVRTRDEIRKERGLPPLDKPDDDVEEDCKCCKKCRCCNPVVTYTFYWPSPQPIYQTHPIYVQPSYPTGTWTIGTGGTGNATTTTNFS